MATATKQSRAARELARRVVHTPESMEFLVLEDNAGDYHWRIVAGDGAVLARSADFASYGEAQQAAEHMREGAGAALYQPTPIH